MEELEKIIKNSNFEKNDFEPHEGHFERFELKLNQQKKRKGHFLQLLSGIAAVLLVAILVYNYTKPSEAQFCLRQVSPEFAEVEDYYLMNINYEEHKLQTLIAQTSNDEMTRQLIGNEMKEFDSQYQQLCAEMKSNPGDERIVNAMIKYYQTKLGVITQILLKLEENNETTNNHQENENINL